MPACWWYAVFGLFLKSEMYICIFLLQVVNFFEHRPNDKSVNKRERVDKNWTARGNVFRKQGNFAEIMRILTSPKRSQIVTKGNFFSEKERYF